MKISVFSLCLFALLAFSSCKKDNFKKDSFDKEDFKKDIYKSCFKFVYPINYTMPDGTTLEVNSEEAMWDTFKAWYEANSDSEEKPVLTYPVDVIFKDDLVKTIATEEEMFWVKKECDEDKWDKELCFDLVYPISYTLPDGTTTSGDKETVWTAIKAWYETNPEYEEKPELVYPVEIYFDDENTQSILNEEGMIEAKKDCFEDSKEKYCFDFVFPLSYTMPDGSNVTGADKEEIWTAIKDWYDANPDSEEKPELVYPVEIVFEDESTQSISNEEEMIDAKKDCFEEWKEEICFDLNYPLTYTLPDETTVVGESEEEIWTAIKAWYEANPNSEEKPILQYPVDVTFEDGSILIFAHEEELIVAKEDCE